MAHMTILDDPAALRSLDPDGMLHHVAALPTQCRAAWQALGDLRLPSSYADAKRVLVAGMGGSAIGGDLAAAVAQGTSSIPVLVHRDYGLPEFVDADTVVIASSYSGNTEEVLAALTEARRRGCPLVAITTGGELARLSEEWSIPLVTFDYRSQPRAALGYSFVCQLAVLQAMGILHDVAASLEEAVALLEEREKELGPDAPHEHNAAKQLAVGLYGRVPVIVGTAHLSPAARRWKTQFNENSKAWAYFEDLPEMNHNALSGIHFPAGAAQWFRVLFLRGNGLHPRTELRLDLTQDILEGQGVVCQGLHIPGESALAQILAAVQLGDYTSCYLAFLNGTDPTDISDIIGLKHRMTGV